MAWPFDGTDPPEMLRRDLLAPPPAMAQGMGALAPTQRGGLSKFLGGVAAGIDKVTSNPLYHRLWSGMVSGMTGDPTAGPRALQKIASVPSIQEELARMRIRQMQREEDEAIAKRQALDRLQTTAISPESPEFRSAYAAAFPEQYGKQTLFDEPKIAPKAVVDPTTGRPIYVNAPEAIGRQPYYKPGMGGEITLPDGTTISMGEGIGTKSQIHDDIVQQANLEGTLGMIGDALRTIQSSPGSTGIGGVVAKPLSGIAGGLEDVGALPRGSGEATAQAIAGASQAQLQQLTTIKEALVPALRPWLADKGPLSIQERTALQNAIGIMSATTDSRQAAQALKTVTTTILANQIKAQRLLMRPSPLDPIASDASAMALAKQLKSLGFTNAEIDAFAESLGYGR